MERTMSLQAAQLLAKSRSDEAAGDIAAALQRAAHALEDARTSDGQEMITAALCRVASIHWRLGHFIQADYLARQALDRTPGASEQVDAFIIAGSCAAALDDLATGEDYLQRAIDLSRQIGYLAGHSLALQYLASHVQLRRGQFDLALATAAQAARLGRLRQQPSVLLLRAWVGQITGERQRAREALEALDGIAPPDQRIIALARYLAGQLALDEGDLPQARSLLDETLAVAEATGHPMLCVGVRIALSRWHRLNDDGSALEWARDAVTMARRMGSRYLEGQALIARGQAAWQVGHVTAAADDLRRALATLDGLDAAYDAAQAALLLSALYQQMHHAEAEIIWRDTARRLTVGGYGFLLERERALALPLLAAQLHTADREARAAADALLPALMRAPPPTLHVTGLGGFEVRQGHRCIPSHAWEQRKAGELFRFLLVQPHHSACRDVIVEALWPGKPPAAAERLLQQATCALRHVLDPDLPEKFPSRYLTVADHHVVLHIPAGSTVDFAQFERAIASAFTAPRDELDLALRRYTGGLFPLDCYTDWSAGPRERLADLYLRGLLYLARQYLEGQCLEQALDCCDRITAQDSWNEEATKIAMLAHIALGDRAGALRGYEALKRALRHDLHLAPRADLRELAEAIRDQQ
jgi:DNA-binding SARP family transcriptional activator